MTDRQENRSGHPTAGRHYKQSCGPSGSAIAVASMGLTRRRLAPTPLPMSLDQDPYYVCDTVITQISPPSDAKPVVTTLPAGNRLEGSTVGVAFVVNRIQSCLDDPTASARFTWRENDLLHDADIGHRLSLLGGRQTSSSLFPGAPSVAQNAGPHLPIGR